MIATFVWNATKACLINLFANNAYWFLWFLKIYLIKYKSKKFMSSQKSQSHKRKEQNNTEWLDELINQIENMKNNISKSA